MSLDMAKDMKESISRVAESPLADIEGKLVNIPLNQYELPDGTVINIGVERFACAEILFDSSSVKLELPELVSLNLHHTRPNALYSADGAGRGIAQLAADSVFRCDVELQTACVSNLVVTGGCAAIENLPERIRFDLENVIKPAVPTCRVKMITNSPHERVLCPWLGGSILGSLGSFHEIYISKKEYEEFGPSIVEKKCP